MHKKRRIFIDLVRIGIIFFELQQLQCIILALEKSIQSNTIGEFFMWLQALIWCLSLPKVTKCTDFFFGLVAAFYPYRTCSADFYVFWFIQICTDLFSIYDKIIILCGFFVQIFPCEEMVSLSLPEWSRIVLLEAHRR